MPSDKGLQPLPRFDDVYYQGVKNMSDDKGLLSEEQIKITAIAFWKSVGEPHEVAITMAEMLDISVFKVVLQAQLSALSRHPDEKLLTPKEILGLAAVSRFYVSHSEQWDFVSCVQSILKAQLAKVAPIMAALKARIQELESK